VVQQGSFARAAAQLGMAPSSLSQTIRQLEERLGTRLLNRTTRSVAPSQAGSRLMARLHPALTELDAAVEEIHSLRDSPSGVLRIHSTRIGAVHYLAALIPDFLKQFPEVTLDLVIDDRLVDIVATRFDAGVRLGERVEKDMVAVNVGGEMERMVVASPAYVEQFGMPAHPRDLRDHRCINFRLPTNLALDQWEFEHGNEKLEVSVRGPLIVNESDVAVQAALGGVGIAYLFAHQVREWLTRGRLLRVLESWTAPLPGFYLYYPSRNVSPALRALIGFLKEQRP
jgi:DNA-binding transcriptional LysR family regulator